MALTVGTKAPDFTVKDTHGNTVKLSDSAGKTVVLYFYPKDDTPVAPKRRAAFAILTPHTKAKDIVVFGVSMDNETSHQAFTSKFNLPFPLLADVDGTLTKAYDVEGAGYSKRVTYVIDGSGTITKVYDSVKTDTHATDILAELGV